MKLSLAMLAAAAALDCAFTTCTYESLDDGLFHTKISTTMDSENFSCGKVEGTTDTCACECADHHKCTLDHAMGDGARVQRDHCEATAPAPTPPPTPAPKPAQPVVATLLQLRDMSVELSTTYTFGPWPDLTSATKDSEVAGLGLVGISMAGSDLTLADFSWLDYQMKGQMPSFEWHPLLQGVHFESNPHRVTKPNRLTGTIPSFGECTSLERFSVREQDLTGTIPSFANCQKLWYFSIQSNRLSGSLPSFDNMAKLSKFVIFDNEFTGSLPAFINSPKVTSIGAEHNKLTGHLPSPVPSLISRYRVDNNQFTGPVPDFSGAANVINIDLHDNMLTGTIPSFAANTKIRAGELNYENNDFTV